MIRRPPRSTQSRSSAASDVYKRQIRRWARCILSAWASWRAPRSHAFCDMADGSQARGGDPRLAVLAEFRRNLDHERRLSPHTSSNYCRDIECLFGLTPGLPLERIQTHVVRRAVAQLHARGLSGKTLARMLSSWRGLYVWLVRHRGFAANPCAGVRAPRGAKTLPKALSPDAASQLLDPAPEGALEVRDKAMFELCYSSGLRLAELVSLDLDAAALAAREGEVTVTGKGRKTRTVPGSNCGRGSRRTPSAHCSYPAVARASRPA